jgi:hypothetical protein
MKLPMARLEPGHVHGAGVALVLVGVGAFGYFQARPVLAARAEARALAGEIESQRQSLQQAQSSRKDAERRIGAVRSQLAARVLPLLPQSHLNERLEELSQLVEASGIKVDKLSPADTDSPGPFPTLALHLVGRGPYAACERLMDTLHTTLVDTAVTSLHIGASPENPDAPVNLDIELLWYTAADAPGSH